MPNVMGYQRAESHGLPDGPMGGFKFKGALVVNILSNITNI